MKTGLATLPLKFCASPALTILKALLNVYTRKFIKWMLTVVTQVQQLSAFCINLIT